MLNLINTALFVSIVALIIQHSLTLRSNAKIRRINRFRTRLCAYVETAIEYWSCSRNSAANDPTSGKLIGLQHRLIASANEIDAKRRKTFYGENVINDKVKLLIKAATGGEFQTQKHMADPNTLREICKICGEIESSLPD